ncbi:MAG: hypothetical protein ABI358_00050 [Ginsengibacter sp.]
MIDKNLVKKDDFTIVLTSHTNFYKSTSAKQFSSLDELQVCVWVEIEQHK